MKQRAFIMKYQGNIETFHKGRDSKTNRNRTLGQKIIRSKLKSEMNKEIKEIERLTEIEF